MNAFDRIARRPVFYAGLALIAVQLFLSAPGLEAQMQEQETRRTDRMAERKSQKDMQLADKARAERAQIALARYQTGCLRVINRDNNDKPISLNEGEPVLDYWNQKPIAAGVVVCDNFGVTGVIDANQKVSELAVLLDLRLIPDAITKVNGGNE
jgi:hypothetical protein